jgi:hypothetical protein
MTTKAHDCNQTEQELDAHIEYIEALEDTLRAAGREDLIPERPPALRDAISRKQAGGMKIEAVNLDTHTPREFLDRVGDLLDDDERERVEAMARKAEGDKPAA